MAKYENFVQNSKKIIGVAANYKSLIKLLKKPIPKEPGIFIKPSTSYIVEGQKIVIPPGFNLNQEIELGVVIGKKCKNVNENNAIDYIAGYCAALDMTATNKMLEARSTGGSWTLGKGFDTSSPVSNFVQKERIEDPHNIEIWCSINGKINQNNNTNDMLFSVSEIISFVSKYMTLEPFDLIITGSPPGMGPVQKGDVIEGGIKDIVSLKFELDK